MIFIVYLIQLIYHGILSLMWYLTLRKFGVVLNQRYKNSKFLNIWQELNNLMGHFYLRLYILAFI